MTRGVKGDVCHRARMKEGEKWSRRNAFAVFAFGRLLTQSSRSHTHPRRALTNTVTRYNILYM